MRRLRKSQLTLSILLGVLVLSVFQIFVGQAEVISAAPPDGSANEDNLVEIHAADTIDYDVIRVDVAEDGARWIFRADGPVHEDGLPDYGNSFVTEAYIYPEGTLEESNGVLADGSPEFPDLVIGKWTCFGWNVGRGIHTETGPMAVTTQIFEFYDQEGNTIVTNGYEVADKGVPVLRAIIGGTGDYVGVTGESSQTFFGVNETEGFNFRFEFKVKKS